MGVRVQIGFSVDPTRKKKKKKEERSRGERAAACGHDSVAARHGGDTGDGGPRGVEGKSEKKREEKRAVE